MSETCDLGMPEAIDRWELSGGTWTVSHVTAESATVDLMRCDGGEVADRIVLTDPSEVRWARAQRPGQGTLDA